MRRPVQTRSAGLLVPVPAPPPPALRLAGSLRCAAHSAVLVPATAAESAAQPRAHPRACVPPRRLQAHHAGGGDGDGGGAGPEVPERGWVEWAAGGAAGRAGQGSCAQVRAAVARRGAGGMVGAARAGQACCAGRGAGAGGLPPPPLPPPPPVLLLLLLPACLALDCRSPAACPAPAACRGLRGRLHVRGAWCRPVPAGRALGPRPSALLLRCSHRPPR